MRTLDSHENVVDSSSSIVPIPPRRAATSRLTILRERRLRAQEGKTLAQESAMDDGPESHDDPETRSQRSTPRFSPALPRLRPSNAHSAPSSELLVAKEANPTSDVAGNAPKPLMQEVRRTLRFKNNEDASSSAPNRPAPSSQPARDLTSKSDLSRSPPDKAKRVRRPRPTDAGEEDLPMQPDVDGRFDGPRARFAGRDGARKRKWYLPRRLTAAHVSSDHVDGKSMVSEDVVDRRVVSFRVEYDGGIDGERLHSGSSRGGVGAPLTDTTRTLESTAAARPSRLDLPIRPASSSDTKRSPTDLEQSQTALSEPSSALQSAIPDVRATSLAGARSMRHQQAQGTVATNTSAIPSGLAPQSIDCVTYGSHSPTAVVDPARSAAFDKLLQQYLGLLQCSPTGVHKPHRVADS